MRLLGAAILVVVATHSACSVNTPPNWEQSVSGCEEEVIDELIAQIIRVADEHELILDKSLQGYESDGSPLYVSWAAYPVDLDSPKEELRLPVLIFSRVPGHVRARTYPVDGYSPAKVAELSSSMNLVMSQFSQSCGDKMRGSQ